MALSVNRVQSLLDAHGEIDKPFLLVGDYSDASQTHNVITFDAVRDALPAEFRRTLGVCLNPGPSDTPALARLRDVHCERLWIIQTEPAMSPSELLALGFQELATEDDCTVSLYSAEVTDRPREWNNAKNWAHPENFDKDLQ